MAFESGRGGVIPTGFESERAAAPRITLLSNAIKIHLFRVILGLDCAECCARGVPRIHCGGVSFNRSSVRWAFSRVAKSAKHLA